MDKTNLAPKEKPQVLAATKTQGKIETGNSKDTTNRELKESRTRYEKGLELYRAGAVSIGPDGYFKVLGFTVDPEKVTCGCPDYQKYKKPCLHYYAVRAYQKNGKPQDASNTQIEARSEALDAKVGVRLSCLTLAVEVLRTYGKPISSKNLFRVASEIERWIKEARVGR